MLPLPKVMLSSYSAKKAILEIYLSDHITYSILTLSAPRDVTNAIRTRSRLRVWVGIVHIYVEFRFFFHGSMKKFNQLAKKNYLKFFSVA